MNLTAQNLTSFYEVTTALCFALLGFWWVVVQRRDEFRIDRTMRLLAYSVALSFVLPGLMSLAALLAIENNALWRIGFGVAGVAGFLQTLDVMRRVAVGSTGGIAVGVVRIAMSVVYVAIAAVAIRPDIPKDLGWNASGIAVEALMVTLFIFLSVTLAWAYFMLPDPD